MQSHTHVNVYYIQQQQQRQQTPNAGRRAIILRAECVRAPVARSICMHHLRCKMYITPCTWPAAARGAHQVHVGDVRAWKGKSAERFVGMGQAHRSVHRVHHLLALCCRLLHVSALAPHLRQPGPRFSFYDCTSDSGLGLGWIITYTDFTHYNTHRIIFLGPPVCNCKLKLALRACVRGALLIRNMCTL